MLAALLTREVLVPNYSISRNKNDFQKGGCNLPVVYMEVQHLFTNFNGLTVKFHKGIHNLVTVLFSYFMNICGALWYNWVSVGDYLGFLEFRGSQSGKGVEK